MLFEDLMRKRLKAVEVALDVAQAMMELAFAELDGVPADEDAVSAPPFRPTPTGQVTYAIGDLYAPKTGEFFHGPFRDYLDAANIAPESIVTEYEDDSLFIWKILPNNEHQTIATRKGTVWAPLIGQVEPRPMGGEWPKEI